jgi:hypothetical protein
MRPKQTTTAGQTQGIDMTAALFLNAALSAVASIAVLGMLAKSIGTGAPRPTRRSRRIALRTADIGAAVVPETYSR